MDSLKTLGPSCIGDSGEAWLGSGSIQMTGMAGNTNWATAKADIATGGAMATSKERNQGDTTGMQYLAVEPQQVWAARGCYWARLG